MYTYMCNSTEHVTKSSYSTTIQAEINYHCIKKPTFFKSNTGTHIDNPICGHYPILLLRSFEWHVDDTKSFGDTKKFNSYLYTTAK